MQNTYINSNIHIFKIKSFALLTFINRFLLLENEWLKNFVSNIIIKNVIREIPNYNFINISLKDNKLRNIDLFIY